MFACFPISGKSCQCELAPIHQRLSLSLSLSSSGAGGASQIYGSGIIFWILMSSIVCPAGNFTPSKSNNIGRCARRSTSNINNTKPKPAYGRQGLDWIVGPEFSFRVFSTSRYGLRRSFLLNSPVLETA